MKRTVLGLGAFAKADMVPMQTEHAAPEAGGGDPRAREWDWNSDYWRNLAAPWGGAHSTAADFATFLRSFMRPDGKALREPTARLMITDHTPKLEAHRGLGFMVGPTGLGKGCSAEQSHLHYTRRSRSRLLRSPGPRRYRSHDGRLGRG